MRASVAGKPMDGTRWHAREASDATDAIVRGANLGTRSRARSRDPLSDGTHAGSRDRTFRGAQTVSIRVDASSMTTISRGTCHSHVRVEGRQSRERRERLPKKTKRQRCISAWICTDDVVEEWNDRRRAGRRVSPLSASPRSARASFPGALHLRGAQHELRPVLEELAERAHRAGRPQARARFLLREDGAR